MAWDQFHVIRDTDSGLYFAGVFRELDGTDSFHAWEAPIERALLSPTPGSAQRRVEMYGLRNVEIVAVDVEQDAGGRAYAAQIKQEQQR